MMGGNFINIASLGVLSMIATYAFISLLSKIFRFFHLLDNPKKYGYKRDPVPYSMGVVFFLVFVLLTGLFIDINPKLQFLYIFGSIVSALSFIDDFFDVSPKLRLFFQIITGTIIGLFFVKTGYLDSLFGGAVSLKLVTLELFDYQIFIMPILFSIIWYVMIFNSLNWSDGIPGLTSGLSFVSFLVLFFLGVKLYFTDTYIGGVENALLIMQMSLIILCSVGVFWFFDVKERILMGDSGTMFLGFMLASLAIIFGGKIATVVVVFGVYLIDAFYVIGRRILSGKSPMKKDFTHLHHRLLQAGLSKPQILIFIYGVSFCFGIASLFLETKGKIFVFFLLIVLVVFVNFFVDIILKIKRKLGK